MGRIRTLQVKGITEKLISKYGSDKFKTEYSQNKAILKSIPEKIPSKKIMNKVAGCIITFLRKEKREAEMLEKQDTEDTSEDEEVIPQ